MSCSATTILKNPCKLKLFKNKLCKLHYTRLEDEKQIIIQRNNDEKERKETHLSLLKSLSCRYSLDSLARKSRNYKNSHCMTCQCRYCM